MIARAAALLLAMTLMAGGASAQEAPQVSVAVTPEGPVTVGTPVEVSVTLLVPTYMPEPPVWPDMQVADAVTSLPERATHPVTRRIGRDTWSGVSRTWRIVPQRPAAYDLGPAEITATYAGPDGGQPVEAVLAVPDVAFTATVPAGAEGIDPFVAATRLSLAMEVDGLPAAPKPGDAFTLTLTTRADGPPAILLPPLSGRLPALPGLRAYPRQPELGDGPTATRSEAVAYVIEAPGRYVFPAVSLDWWNSASGTRETAATAAVTIDVPVPPGWRDPGAPAPWRRGLSVALAGLFLGAGLVVLFRRGRRSGPPSPRALKRALRRAVRRGPVGAIRPAFGAWVAALPRPAPDGLRAVESALAGLERNAYGPTAPQDDSGLRRQVIEAVDAVHPVAAAGAAPPLPGINDVVVGEVRAHAPV